jgi:NADPH:quinone reductase-like Zn-dependent oxidoreductase
MLGVMTWPLVAGGGPPQEGAVMAGPGDHVRCLPEWSAVPAPGSRVLVTGAAGGLGARPAGGDGVRVGR